VAETSARKPPSPLRLQVLHSRWLTPHMVRVVLGGDGFAGFVDNGFTDRYVKLVFPARGHPLPDPLDVRAAPTHPAPTRTGTWWSATRAPCPPSPPRWR
jgi:NADPH-dependent ferric siderophore reductase